MVIKISFGFCVKIIDVVWNEILTKQRNGTVLGCYVFWMQLDCWEDPVFWTCLGFVLGFCFGHQHNCSYTQQNMWSSKNILHLIFKNLFTLLFYSCRWRGEWTAWRSSCWWCSYWCRRFFRQTLWHIYFDVLCLSCSFERHPHFSLSVHVLIKSFFLILYWPFISQPIKTNEVIPLIP